jgi:hypothetical protein
LRSRKVKETPAPKEDARLGQVRAEPANIFRPNFINGLRNWTLGQPYTPDHVARLRPSVTSTSSWSSNHTWWSESTRGLATKRASPVAIAAAAAATRRG